MANRFKISNEEILITSQRLPLKILSSCKPKLIEIFVHKGSTVIEKSSTVSCFPTNAACWQQQTKLDIISRLLIGRRGLSRPGFGPIRPEAASQIAICPVTTTATTTTTQAKSKANSGQIYFSCRMKRCLDSIWLGFRGIWLDLGLNWSGFRTFAHFA